MQLIETQPETKRTNQRLVLRALAALSEPTAGIASPYAPDVTFFGPASALWPEAGATDALGLLSNPCLEIERVDPEDDRVLTHATLRRPPAAKRARCSSTTSPTGGSPGSRAS